VSLNPWDIAAGALLIQEAGGTITGMSGAPLNIYGKQVLASNGRIHNAMLEILRKTG
jgi:myo-inositol-1(or 4)-monophosphatase